MEESLEREISEILAGEEELPSIEEMREFSRHYNNLQDITVPWFYAMDNYLQRSIRERPLWFALIDAFRAGRAYQDMKGGQDGMAR